MRYAPRPLSWLHLPPRFPWFGASWTPDLFHWRNRDGWRAYRIRLHALDEEIALEEMANSDHRRGAGGGIRRRGRRVPGRGAPGTGTGSRRAGHRGGGEPELGAGRAGV